MIAILVLTYNNIESTRECIGKLYRHTKSDFKLFILDNNSTDGTVEYLSSLRYDNLKIHLSTENMGIINGRNYIYNFSKEDSYDYLCFLDNDQFVEEGWDLVYVNLMKRYDVIGIEAWQMKSNFQPFRRIKDKSEYFDYVGCGGMMIRRDVVEEIGLFDTKFNPKYFEDPQFCFRAIKNGYKVGWCDGKVIEHQKHDLTLSPKERVFFMRNLRIMQKEWRGFPLPKIKNEGRDNG